MNHDDISLFVCVCKKKNSSSGRKHCSLIFGFSKNNRFDFFALVFLDVKKIEKKSLIYHSFFP